MSPYHNDLTNLNGRFMIYHMHFSLMFQKLLDTQLEGKRGFVPTRKQILRVSSNENM